MSSTRKLGSLLGNFYGHITFLFTCKKTIFLEDSKIFFKHKKIYATKKITNELRINLSTCSKKKTKIENLP